MSLIVWTAVAILLAPAFLLLMAFLIALPATKFESGEDFSSKPPLDELADKDGERDL